MATEEHVCEQLARSLYCKRLRIESATVWSPKEHPKLNTTTLASVFWVGYMSANVRQVVPRSVGYINVA